MALLRVYLVMFNGNRTWMELEPSWTVTFGVYIMISCTVYRSIHEKCTNILRTECGQCMNNNENIYFNPIELCK